MAYFDCQIVQGGGGIILTVTCDSVYAGTTITATDGETTLTATCPSSSPYTVEFKIPNSGSWTISGIASGETGTTTVIIPDNATLGVPIPTGSTVTPTDSVQIWMNCANVWDKNYTTISQVLADTSLVTTLIASNNAVDYMARSTSWASSVAANASAMTKIGVNDYCADKLLDDSTWLNAICNSTYFERVLDVKVPTMTSATSPSGIVSVSLAQDSNPGYRAFDGNNNTTWITYRNGASGEGKKQWIMYQFPQKVRVVKAKIRPYFDGNLRMQSFNIATSDDGATFDPAVYSGSFNNSSSEVYDHFYNFSNSNKRSRCRLYINDSFNSPSIGVYEVQFWGRA